ncbi:hypothetical protein IFT54_06970 [Sphingomonas sp. CFBP 13714]|uniref:hypothetical protein n=1 Tax=Sphingomonas sp. CFBP 13714 TaxID=2775308 RepID=UPI0017838722|nr:hypothetical protein [Sphingomonas sp. CFBP 13714]MBD8699554.1 hypothetical protein [Sphingomonas sp. CFBP 13714]
MKLLLFLASLVVSQSACAQKEQSDEQIAQTCQISLESYHTTRALVKAGPVGKLTKAGRCYLSRNTDRRIMLGYISEPPTESK